MLNNIIAIIHSFSNEQLKTTFLPWDQYDNDGTYPIIINDTHKLSVLASGHLSFLYARKTTDGTTTIFRIETVAGETLGYYEISYDLNEPVVFDYTEELEPYFTNFFSFFEPPIKTDIFNMNTYLSLDMVEHEEMWEDFIWEENIPGLNDDASMIIGGFPKGYSTENWPHLTVGNNLIPVKYLADVFRKGTKYTIFLSTPEKFSSFINPEEAYVISINNTTPDGVVLKEVDEDIKIDELTTNVERYYTDEELPHKPVWLQHKELTKQDNFIIQINDNYPSTDTIKNGSVYLVKNRSNDNVEFIWQKK
jgi:hypothetical protein